jgi:hypothetical protein
MALNVDGDLEPFSRINPCGYEELEMTDLKRLGIELSLEDAAEKLLPFLLRHLGAADNTPSHACGYRFGYVVHCAPSGASQVRAPTPCRDQDGAGQVAESIAELAVRQKYVARTEHARRVRLPVPPRLRPCLLVSVSGEFPVTKLLGNHN